MSDAALEALPHNVWRVASALHNPMHPTLVGHYLQFTDVFGTTCSLPYPFTKATPHGTLWGYEVFQYAGNFYAFEPIVPKECYVEMREGCFMLNTDKVDTWDFSPTASEALVNGTPVPMWWDDKNFLHVGDTTMTCAQALSIFKVIGARWNVSGGRTIPYQQIINMHVLLHVGDYWLTKTHITDDLSVAGKPYDLIDGYVVSHGQALLEVI